jgi:hypothetical protein
MAEFSAESWFMKDVYLILRQKESDLARLRVEVDSLRLVAPLLRDESSHEEGIDLTSSDSESEESFPDPQSTGTDGPLSSIGNSGSRFWGLMKKSRE